MKRYFVLAISIVFCMVLLNACGDNKSSTPWLPPPETAVSRVTVSNFQAASVVIGQPTFTTPSVLPSSPTPTNMSSPWGDAAVLDGKLYLPDWIYKRVLVLNSIPTTNGAAADGVLGQANLTSSATGSAANQMAGPQTVTTYNGKLFVVEWSNHRVLIWNSAPSGTQPAADLVVGQPAFGSIKTSCTQTGLFQPESIETAAGKLIVADSGNNRVLIWNSIPTTNGAPADIVLGQGYFDLCEANDDLQTGIYTTPPRAPTNRTLSYPTGVWSDGTRLIVADTRNNRVLIWEKFPTTNFTPADHVLGQGDFVHVAANDDLQTGVSGTASARTFNYPYFIDSNGVQLFLADQNNNRVLVWDTIPGVDFARADRVLGQGDFTHTACNDDNQNGSPEASPTARTLCAPKGIYLYGTKLIMTDGGNRRFLIYDSQ